MRDLPLDLSQDLLNVIFWMIQERERLHLRTDFMVNSDAAMHRFQE
jgi:hypothetical protein